MKNTLTVIIPTFNEEKYIAKALYSARFADEIIVIDSFSSDNTLEIVKQHNCRVYQRQFDNFSNQKNHALQYVTSEWILFLDADERITIQLENEITQVLKNPQYTAYKIRFPHFYMNRYLKHHYDKVVRLVKRDHCHFEGSVHEKLVVKGSIGMLKSPMLHYTYKGLEHYIGKKDSYSWFQAKQLFDKGKRPTYFHFIFKPFFRFFKSYIIRKGFMDGVPGLAVSGINAYGVFLRYAKLRLIIKDLE